MPTRQRRRKRADALQITSAAVPIERALEAYRKALPVRTSLRGGGSITAKHAANEIAHAAAAVATLNVAAKTVDDITAADSEASAVLRGRPNGYGAPSIRGAIPLLRLVPGSRLRDHEPVWFGQPV